MKPEACVYNESIFVHVGQKRGNPIECWDEYQPSEQNPRTQYFFKEILRDNTWIYLFDWNRRIWVAIPKAGGTCYYQYWLPENQLPRNEWVLLYEGGIMANGMP